MVWVRLWLKHYVSYTRKRQDKGFRHACQYVIKIKTLKVKTMNQRASESNETK